MAIITRPDQLTPQGNAQVSLGSAARAGAGTISAGEAVTAAGRQFAATQVGQLAARVGSMVSAEGEAYFEQSKKAHQVGVLTNVMADATMKFMDASGKRSQQVTDQHGNPVFTSLVSDVKSIGDGIKNNILKNIIDPEIAAAFSNEFGSFVANQQVKAFSHARAQQAKYASSSLEKGLSALIAQGSADSMDNVGQYELQAQKLLDRAHTAGIINKDKHDELLGQFSYITRKEALKNTILSTPGTAGEILKRPASQLGVSEEDKARLSDTLTAKITSDKVELLKAKQVAEQDRTNTEALTAEGLKQKIDAGALREDELLANFSKVSQKSFSELRKHYTKKAKKEQDLQNNLGEISVRLAQNEPLTGVKSNLIEEHYKRLVESQSQSLGHEATLGQKAEIANIYGVKIKSIATEIDSTLKGGSPENAAEAIAAYTYLRDQGSRILDGTTVSKTARMIATHTEQLIERAGLDPAVALVKSREAIEQKATTIGKERIKDFRADDAFYGENLRDTVSSELDIDSFFGFGGVDVISDDTISTYRQFAEEAYIATGDMDTAKKYATTMINHTHGITEVNGEESYMYAPPEKLFPGVPASALRAQMLEDVRGIVSPELSDSVGVYSDALTKGTILTTTDKETGAKREIELYSYGLQTTDPDTGIILPVVDPNTGELLRWYPDIDKIVGTVQATQQQTTQTELEKAIAAENAAKGTPTPGGSL